MDKTSGLVCISCGKSATDFGGDNAGVPICEEWPHCRTNYCHRCSLVHSGPCGYPSHRKAAQGEQAPPSIIGQVEDVLSGLAYIADSPSEEHGGFHPNAVETAKKAIALIEALRGGKQ